MPTGGHDHPDRQPAPTGSGHERWFRPHRHDVEVRRGRYDYWVRGIRRREAYLSTGDGVEALFLLPIAGLIALVRGAGAERSEAWRVGVLRFERDGGASPGVLMYDEPLAEHADVAAHVARLAQHVAAGELDDVKVPPLRERMLAGVRRYPKDGYPRGSRRLP